MQFIVDYESSDYCGGREYVIVEADNESDVEEIATEHMSESMLELFADEYEEDDLDHEDMLYIINSIEVFDKDHPCWKYAHDPIQMQFYPRIS